MTIKELLMQKRRNLDGQEYNLFDAKNRDKEIEELALTLGNYLCAVLDNLPKEKHEVAKYHFHETIKRISAIRIDASGAKTEPVLSSVAEFISPFMSGKDEMDKRRSSRDYILNHDDKDIQGLINKKPYDATTHANNEKEGITIFAPIIKSSQKLFSKVGELEAEKIFIHEFVHASSAWTKQDNNGENHYVQGIKVAGSGVYDDFNEGLTEFYALKIMKGIYPNHQIRTGYNDRVNMVEDFMANLSKEEQDFMFESFINGKGNEILDFFNEKKDEKGNSIRDYLDEYQNNGLGLGGGFSKTSGQSYQLFGDKIKNCLQSQAERN